MSVALKTTLNNFSWLYTRGLTQSKCIIFIRLKNIDGFLLALILETNHAFILYFLLSF